jgi:hypothetical protein
MNEPLKMPPGASKHLDMPEGTVKIGYVLPVPLADPPEDRLTLVEDESPANTVVRFEVDQTLRLHFVRQAPEGKPADVSVDISPLRNATRLDIFGIWSPTLIAVHVVDRDNPKRTVRREVSAP